MFTHARVGRPYLDSLGARIPFLHITYFIVQLYDRSNLRKLAQNYASEELTFSLPLVYRADFAPSLDLRLFFRIYIPEMQSCALDVTGLHTP